MTGLITEPRVAEGQIARAIALDDGREVQVALTARVTTPGECCVSIASSLRFDYTPALVEDIAVRLDDRLYDGLYAGLAAHPGPLPPEHLTVEIVALTSEPSLASLVADPDWALIGQLGAALEAAAAAAVEAAAAKLLTEVGR